MQRVAIKPEIHYDGNSDLPEFHCGGTGMYVTPDKVAASVASMKCHEWIDSQLSYGTMGPALTGWNQVEAASIHAMSKLEHISLALARYPLPPYPNGWYFVARSADLSVGKLISRQWLGREIIAWRNQQHEVCIADAFCPHMGGRLAPEAGGKLRDGLLVCPFHGLSYDVAGECVASPSGMIPPDCRLASLPVCEVNGFVLAYWHHAGLEPDFQPPEADEQGWSGIRSRPYALNCHPQDVAENSVDLSHLPILHDYKEVKQVRKGEARGQCFTTAISFRVDVSLPLVGAVPYPVVSEIRIWGLGFSFIENTLPALGLMVRIWFLSTPVGVERIDVIAATQIKEIETDATPAKLIRLLPGFFRMALLQKVIAMGFAVDFRKDSMIWNNKIYRERPRLRREDGDILAFRRYCRQFYPAE